MIRVFLDTNDSKVPQLYLTIMDTGIAKISDAYYLALDSNINDQDESIHKVKLVFKELLQRWFNDVQSLQEKGECCFLPFDFSDQYIGGIQVELIDDSNIQVNYNETEKVSGFSISPSDYKRIILSKEDFFHEPSYFKFDREDFLSSLKENL